MIGFRFHRHSKIGTLRALQSHIAEFIANLSEHATPVTHNSRFSMAYLSHCLIIASFQSAKMSASSVPLVCNLPLLDLKQPCIDASLGQVPQLKNLQLMQQSSDLEIRNMVVAGRAEFPEISLQASGLRIRSHWISRQRNRT